jgi:hypothetical protein
LYFMYLFCYARRSAFTTAIMTTAPISATAKL